MNSSSLKVVTGHDWQSIPLGVNDHKVLENIDILNLLAILGLHESNPGLWIGVVPVGTHDPKVLLWVSVGEDVVVILLGEYPT